MASDASGDRQDPHLPVVIGVRRPPPEAALRLRHRPMRPACLRLRCPIRAVRPAKETARGYRSPISPRPWGHLTAKRSLKSFPWLGAHGVVNRVRKRPCASRHERGGVTDVLDVGCDRARSRPGARFGDAGSGRHAHTARVADDRITQSKRAALGRPFLSPPPRRGTNARRRDRNRGRRRRFQSAPASRSG